uniref:Uncharacterized protein n=1 Tax=Arundo donax TaxID=35708 RepID=A0A0A9B3Q7_ARUDO
MFHVLTFCNLYFPHFAHEQGIHSNVSCHAYHVTLIIESHQIC